MLNSALMIAFRAALLAAGLLFSVAAAETYTVKAGDTLYSVARQFNLDPQELMQRNTLDSTTIQVGQRLDVPGTSGQSAAPKAAAAADNASGARKDGVVRAAALRFMGIPYRLGGTGKGSIDCSAYTRLVMQQMGIALPRTAREQYKVGSPVTKEDLRAGDLLFFNTLGNGISHVGIYLGGGQFAHANSYLGRTVVEDLNGVYYRFRYVGARRVLPSS